MSDFDHILTVFVLLTLYSRNTGAQLLNHYIEQFIYIYCCFGTLKFSPTPFVLDLLTSGGNDTISQERLQLQSPAREVCAVHSMQPLPNYFGLLLR